MTEDIPTTPFEEALVRGARQEESLAEILGKFWNELLVVPSGADVSVASNTLQPVLFARESDRMMAVYTDFGRIPGDISSKAPYAVRLHGRDLLRGVQPGVGLVVNPGTTWGFEILPSSIPAIVATFGQTPTESA
ncbi:MAG TPA: SseB family protein [Pseudolysinimonas sp.]|jgi:hypothetical protein